MSSKSRGAPGAFGRQGTQRKASVHTLARENQRLQIIAKALIEELDLAKEKINLLTPIEDTKANEENAEG